MPGTGAVRACVSWQSGLFIATAKPVPRVGWPGYNWWSEALHGVAREGISTSFPQICGVAASYNRSLWNLIGSATGLEARGLNNGCSESAQQGASFHGLTMWSPNINIFRDPRWGRGQVRQRLPTAHGAAALSSPASLMLLAARRGRGPQTNQSRPARLFVVREYAGGGWVGSLRVVLAVRLGRFLRRKTACI